MGLCFVTAMMSYLNRNINVFLGLAYFNLHFLDFHLVGVIWIGRWAGERKERITEVTS